MISQSIPLPLPQSWNSTGNVPVQSLSVVLNYSAVVGTNTLHVMKITDCMSACMGKGLVHVHVHFKHNISCSCFYLDTLDIASLSGGHIVRMPLICL